MALTLLAANNAQTVLAAGISSSATSITVNTGTGALFPSPVSGTGYFKLTLVDAATGSLTEIVHVTARSGDVMTIQRGQEGTTARAWSANDLAANMMTAGSFDALLQKQSNLADLGNPATARANLGFDALGFGLSNNALLSAFDWQQVDFTTGARYLVSSSTWTNAPSGVNYPAGTQVFIAVDGITSSGTVIELTLIANQANDANYRIYKVRIANAKGSRTFTVRQIFTSADVIPTANLDAPGRLLGVKIITSTGTYTKTPGTNKADVLAVGGGAGGGYSISSSNYNAGGGGGGAGGHSRSLIDLTGVSTVSCTIGSGGTRGIAATQTSPLAGGVTSFGSYLSATGGFPGGNALAPSAVAVSAVGGKGGTGTTGTVLGSGGSGMPSVVSSSAAGASVGNGFGGQSALSGQPGYGAGGNGGQTTGGNQSVDGSNGSAGAILILEYA